MQIGSFKVPQIRLDALLNIDLKKIYDSVKTEQIQSKDMSTLLGYKHGTEPTLFKKINSMLAYGILEGRGIYNITKLGEGLLFPESDETEQELKAKAFFNVTLWKKLFEIYQKSPPKDGLWVQIKNIAEIDPASAKKYENRVYSWYMEDVSGIAEDIVNIEETNVHKTSSTTLRSSSTRDKHRSRTDVETISFDKYEVTLPKGDLSKEWEKLKKYMDIKLEDYQYEEPKEKEAKEDMESAKEIIEEEQEKFAERMNNTEK